MSMFKPAAPAPAKPNPRAAMLVEELIDVAASTDAGTKASADKRRAIEELVEELQQFSVKNASKSSLLAGEYEVLYASAPAGPGGPLEGPAGAIPYSGKKPRQTISASGELTNDVEFKQFGMLEGFSRQFGKVKAISPDTYEVELESAQFKSGLGPAEKLSLESELSVQLLYLGEDLRVVRNQVKGEDNSDLIVYRRIADSDDEEEEEEAPAPAKRSGTMSIFGGGSSSTREGTATMAERQVNRQMAEEAAKKAKQGGTGTVQAAPRSGTMSVQRGGTASVAAKPAVDPRVEQRKAAEADKEKEAKAARERQSAIKELLATLSDQLKEAQEEAKDALKEFKDLEKSSSGALREVAAARADVKDAEEETAEAAKKLDQALGARKEAEGRASEAAAALALAQAKLKQAASSLTATV